MNKLIASIVLVLSFLVISCAAPQQACPEVMAPPIPSGAGVKSSFTDCDATAELARLREAVELKCLDTPQEQLAGRCQDIVREMADCAPFRAAERGAFAPAPPAEATAPVLDQARTVNCDADAQRARNAQITSLGCTDERRPECHDLIAKTMHCTIRESLRQLSPDSPPDPDRQRPTGLPMSRTWGSDPPASQ